MGTTTVRIRELSEAELLKITYASDLFDDDIEICKKQYKAYSRKYHPDAGYDRNCFIHISELYNQAIKQIEEGTWEKKNCIKQTCINGKQILFKYLYAFTFELGICYVCSKKIIYFLDADKKKYLDNAIKRINGLRYGNDEMKEVLSRCVPIIHSYGELKDYRHYLVLEKTEDVYPLKKLLEAMGEIPPEHVAWIISRLSSLCCFLEYNGLVHNGIDMNSCFISPEYHSVLLLGGWWYTVEDKKELIGTTKEIYDLMPVLPKSNKTANIATDLECVKKIGRNLFNEKTCRSLFTRTDIPADIIMFLAKGPESDAIKEMKIWDTYLENAYGVRKFIKLNITKNEIYKTTT